MYYINTFLIFSLLGHFVENFFYSHTDSGILFGPWTPIYGLGVVTIILIGNIIKNLKVNQYFYPIFLFIISVLLLSSLEYFGGILIEQLFGKIFWDYSNQQFNIGKYTSLRMGLIWGLSSIFTIYLIKPILNIFVKKYQNLLLIF